MPVDTAGGRDLAVIIPAAGLGRRMKSYGPKSLIDLGNGQTVLGRQLTLVAKTFPAADIVVVVGFEADRIRKIVPPNVRVITNKHYEITNVSYSIELGLMHTRKRKALIIYGDLVFNEETLGNLDLSGGSTVVYDANDQFHDSEVGVNILDDHVTSFSYGLPVKWAQIVCLRYPEMRLFRKAVADRVRRKFFGYEILNEVLERGGQLSAVSPLAMQIAEIDSSKDIESAQRISESIELRTT